ncbi:phospholipid-binding lipoprotein MlaA [Endobacter medicaginis]|jgi:phospholipid-binding lipoprotein MlaA|uniref:Phospholipid-binding lipoprotein MlaA n=2 Tax=Endobacter medicaginis TaxID=1181271 RepID=A0A839UXP5_9PROT|nr:VacJ family lipoprotein [Endobacter medicaginis]MBB3173143.1 phospholipid-binding lipoprotein MlaA [Endobacter medicaginis]MCX5476973.1 VacJ family lipoprotein [Endobacter medicaginis]
MPMRPQDPQSPARQIRRGNRGGAVASLSLAIAVSLAGCATKPTDPDALAEYNQTNDPLEPTNRTFYNVSTTLDRYTLKPVAKAYVWAVPAPVRTGAHNLLSNINSPVVFFNDVAEAKPRRAGDTFMRFVINSTVGVAGIFDVATGWGWPAHTASGNLTLGSWGIPQGPYLFVPLVGPSSFRGVAGTGIDIGVNPLNYVPRGYGLLTLNWSLYGLNIVDARAQVLDQLDAITKDALDPYATIRSLYRQHTQAELDALENDHRATVPNWYSDSSDQGQTHPPAVAAPAKPIPVRVRP